MIKQTLVALAASFFVHTATADALNPDLASGVEGWEQAINDSDLAVYIKSIPGKDTKAFKAFTYIQAPKEKIFERVKDLPSYCDWFADCGGARFLKVINDKESIGYFINKTPWPVDDRDATFHRTLSTTASGGLKLRLVAETGHLEEQACCVRLNDADGYILVEDHIAGESSKVTYEFYSDPGGDIPAWLINSMITQSPETTLRNLKALFEK